MRAAPSSSAWTDDGRGLDVVRIKAKAVERGILTRAEADAMSDGQAFKLIFAPGFSTAEAVTAVSGRGVGMDVVRSNIEQIGGQVEIASTLGQGAAFTIKIPLTLAIMPALVIGLSGQRFAVPQSNVTELVRAGEQTDHRIEVINGVRLLRLRDELLPLIQLAPLLGLGEASEGMAYVVVMQVGANRLGVAVDEILDTEEIVVKPLAPTLRDMGEYAGATILGDGSVILILEPNSLASMAGEAPASVRAAGVATDTDHAQARRSLLLVQAGSDALKVAPLDRVSRLEHARGEDIQMVGGRAVLQYRGRMMPILAVPGVRIRREGAQPLLVLSGDGFSMGLAVDAIVDMLEDHLSLEMEASEPGFLGSALVAGRTVEVIDVEYFLAIAGAELTAEARSQYFEEVAA